MNLLGHIQVARTQSDQPAFWLGSALPDLEREAGVALGDVSVWPAEVRAGIACHHRADATFHDLAAFRTQSIALTRALLDAGVPRGAARAVGHAGWELLFDGALLTRDDALVDAYLAAMRHPVADDAWAAALRRRFERGSPWFYADPDAVTELLRRVLSRRRLLAFDAAHAPAVAAALHAAQPAVENSVDEILTALIDLT